MSILVSCQDIAKAFGPTPLFQGVSLGIADNDKLAIIGPNGAGKSTLLKILAGELQPDEGIVALRKNTELVYVSQQSNFPAGKTIRQIMEAALESLPGDEAYKQTKMNQTLGRIGFSDLERDVSSLSGGWKKRLSIACALVRDPALLLLDEPTNHLDLEGILWLEGFLGSAQFAFAIISHDRYFLENVTNRTLEVNRVYPGNTFTAAGSYSQFLAAKAEFISGQLQTQASMANKLRQEVEWLSRGPKARSTKQQARINAAEQLKVDFAEIRQRTKEESVSIDFNFSQRKTKKLIQLKAVQKTLGDKKIIRNLDLTLSPGVRLGLLGLNASGKTTLLKILAGKIPIDSGVIEKAENLRLVYFEQNREALNPNLSLKRTLAESGDSVIANGRSVHVVSWAKKFLFRPEQLDVPISKLSGGEQARVLIAKLMLEPADVLLLDEPTNDLDIETLEILEESLQEFAGAVVLVTHDRYMLDRVANIILALDGKGGTEFCSDYNQWQQLEKEKGSFSNKNKAVKTAPTPTKNEPSKKLTYNEQREYSMMESNIAEAEKNLETCQAVTDDPKLASNSIKLQEAYANLKEAQDLVEKLYTRWAELESKIK